MNRCILIHLAVVAPVLVLLLGLINPNFTPEHLAKGAKAIIHLDLGTVAGDRAVPVTAVAVLKGAAPAGLRLAAEAKDFAAELGTGGVGLLFTGDFSAARDGGDAPQGLAGALCVGTKWFLIRAETDGRMTIIDDDGKLDLKAVWSGDERSLEGVVTTLLADPRTTVPVVCETAWRDSRSLGRVPGRLHGCLAARFATDGQPGILVLSEDGDRYFRSTGQEGAYADLTGQLKLATRSRCAAIGDFTGSGGTGLATWDGARLAVLAPAANGTLAATPLAVPLADCHSLSLCATSATRSGLVAGTGTWPMLVRFDGPGAAATPVATGSFDVAAWGEAGPCLVADLDEDGIEDVVQACSRGLLLYHGDGPGRWSAPKLACPLDGPVQSLAFGDFDGDGRLDLIAIGGGRWHLLANRGAGRFADATAESGEAFYSAQGGLTTVVVNDLTCDGREEPLFLRSNGAPLPFFNRGFACFGFADDLDEKHHAGLEAMADGQAGGLVADLDSDGMQELVLISGKSQDVWLYHLKNDGGRVGLAVTVDPGLPGTHQVRASDGRRGLGARLIGAGSDAFIGKRSMGPLALSWTHSGATAVTKQVNLTRAGQRFRIPSTP